MKTLRQEGADAGELEFTGERYLPEVDGQIAFEHLHRYHFAARHAVGMTVLDVACGEGYGTNILAAVARVATGLDISMEAVGHASAEYVRENLSFVAGSAAELPFPDATFDLVVSFETIEHHDRHEEMISEIHRVLRPGGLLIISSPNKQYYSIESGYQNPFHVKELLREEFVDLLASSFKNVQLHGQRVVYGSVLVPEEPAPFQSFSHTCAGDDLQISDGLAKPHYDVAMASDATLPSPATSIFEMTVHGLDPATFYGVHLPERIASADAELTRLQAEASAREADRSDARAEFQARIDALRNIHEQLGHELRERQDARIQALQDVAVEKEVRLQAAAESKRQLESWLAELQLHASNLEARRGQLENELSASTAHASGLKVQLAEHEARTAHVEGDLRQSVAHCEALALERAVAQAKSEDLAADLAARDTQINAYAADLAARDARLQRQAADMAEFDARLHSQTADLAERDARLQRQAADLAERDFRLQSLAADLAERDLRLQSLTADLAGRNALLQNRSDQLADSEALVRRTTDLLSQAQESALENLAYVARLEEQIRRITASRSWRYTAMFRRTPK